MTICVGINHSRVFPRNVSGTGISTLSFLTTSIVYNRIMLTLNQDASGMGAAERRAAEETPQVVTFAR